MSVSLRTTHPIGVVERYFGSGAVPTIAQQFTPGRGWRPCPLGERVSRRVVRALGAEGVTAVALSYGGRLADFRVEELLAAAPAPGTQDGALMSVAMSGSLWEFVDEHRRLEAIWRETRREEDRRAMAGVWSIAITAPGDERFDDGEPMSDRWSRCTPTVLCRDHWPRRPHLEYRGACLGCGWVSPHTHWMGAGGENAAVEDAHDHTHPGWRELPVLAATPSIDSPTGHKRMVERWRARWEPLLPAGWLDQGGPIRTKRSPLGTRHVPGRAPGGGYDLAAGADEREIPGGQLELF